MLCEFLYLNDVINIISRVPYKMFGRDYLDKNANVLGILNYNRFYNML